jgi:ribosomal protein S18 acetylase RimI-like enzyme
VGEVTAIYHGGKNAGFYWVEARGRILHLHSLVVKNEYRGRGIGREVLKRLEYTYRDSIDTIELGLHESNQQGLELYQNEGFEKQEFIEDIGFIILQKPLMGER